MAPGGKRTASKAEAKAPPTKKVKKAIVQLRVPTAPQVKGLVMVCGQGDVGQLGLGERTAETTKYLYIDKLGDNIVDVHAGGMHTIALDSNGKVYTFGCNDEGALGRAASDDEEGVPAVVPLPAPAVAISCGDSHSAALLSNGDVYAWGAFRDSHGTMGLVFSGSEAKVSKEPTKIQVPEPAAAIASGGDHLVILTISNAVYTMGCGEQGQLGRVAQRSASREARFGFSNLLTPAKVTQLKAGASAIWAGHFSTFALDAAGENMYAWGLNNYQQLGVPGEKKRCALYAPSLSTAFAGNPNGWKEVSCGQHHTVAMDNMGHVYAIGRHEYGRLGLGVDVDAPSLERIPSLERCVSISAGPAFSLCVTDKGELYGWGMNSEGNLGTGDTEDRNVPQRCELQPRPRRLVRPLRVWAGGQHTVVLAEDLSKIGVKEVQEAAAAVPVPEAKKAEPPAERTVPVHAKERDNITSIVKTRRKINGNDENHEMEVDETDAPSENVEKEEIDDNMEEQGPFIPHTPPLIPHTPPLPHPDDVINTDETTSNSNSNSASTEPEPKGSNTKSESNDIADTAASGATANKDKDAAKADQMSLDDPEKGVSDANDPNTIAAIPVPPPPLPVDEPAQAKQVSDRTTEVGAVSKEVGAPTKPVGAVAMEVGEVSNEAGAADTDAVNGTPEGEPLPEGVRA